MKTGLLPYLLLILIGGFVLLISYDDDRQLWGEIDAPNLDYQIMLYQKERIMHQAPEILVYFQKKGSSITYPIGNILLPEDNRSPLTYDYQWSPEGALTLILRCDKCMIEQRKYQIDMEKEKPTLTKILEDTKRSV
ncbi:hypothetical protein [Aureispira anguillae]|uniref:Uncharacterized protein n=1 Tax=Aureispira anguillae TaxID=2864201 RepID=A0A915VMS8_9BACT|nr:hypothetical protein [Aureispira anguillae]BDS09684.1 hypothetical protein AsAng_0003880 [Aureispira anguillae]